MRFSEVLVRTCAGGLALAALAAVSSCRTTSRTTAKDTTGASGAGGLTVADIKVTKFEHPAADEQADIAKVISLMQGMQQGDKDAGRFVHRFTHAKTLACAAAKFVVDADLPAELQVGLFKTPGATFNTWARFSSQEKQIRPDSERDNRGMALKLMGVPGQKLLSNGTLPDTLDLVLTQGQVFFMDTPKDFLNFFLANAAGQGAAWFAQHPAFTQAREGLLDEGKIKSLFDGNFNGMAPFLFGPDRVVRFSADSCAPKRSGLGTGDNYLREQLKTDLAGDESHCFDITAMFYIDEATTPIEIGTGNDWKQPKVHLAKLIFPKQDPSLVDSGLDNCENLQFNPWHTLPEHQPLGGLNRLRLSGYKDLGWQRHNLNGRAAYEPSAETFPLK